MSTVSSSTWVSESLTDAQFPFIQTVLSFQVLYPLLPGQLDCNPFRESPDPQAPAECAGAPGSGGLQVPGEIQQIVEVLTETWRLLSDCHLHPEISSQFIGYLFYFINASLFNSLMERGTSITNLHTHGLLREPVSREVSTIGQVVLCTDALPAFCLHVTAPALRSVKPIILKRAWK